MQAFPQLSLRSGDGCGNRFLLVLSAELGQTGESAERLAQRVCGQHYDGLLVLGSANAQAQEIRIVNRDGSDGGCCLNGCRVAAAHHGGRRGKLRMAGHDIAWRQVADGIELALPLRLGEIAVNPISLPGKKNPAESLTVHGVDYWNPHVVVDMSAARTLLDCTDSFAAFPLADLAQRLRRELQHFPQGVNVGLMERPVEGVSGYRLRVDERGVGETAACGSGALAASAMLWKEGEEGRLLWQMGGGHLLLERDSEGKIHLSGRAQVTAPVTLASLLRVAPK